MEKDVLEKYKMNSRAEAVAFLKSLWNEAPQPCPLCNGKLDFISFSINKKYPIKVLKYDKNGILDSTSLFVSNNESYVFDLNKKLIAHWKGNNCYNEKGELIMTREAK